MSRQQRQPFETVDENRSTSTTRSRRSRRNTNPAPSVLETENDTVLVQEASTKTPKISNRRGKPPRSKKSVLENPITLRNDRPVSNRRLTDRMEKAPKARGASKRRRELPSERMEGRKPSIRDSRYFAVQQQGDQRPAHDESTNHAKRKRTLKHVQASTKHSTTRSTVLGPTRPSRLECPPRPTILSTIDDSKRKARVKHLPSKRLIKQVKPPFVGEDSKGALRTLRCQPSHDSGVAKTILYSSTHLQTSDDTDSMDCSSDEGSLGLDVGGPGSLLTQEEHILRPRDRMESSSFTSSKLTELRKSKVDNPKVLSAMFASRPSPEKSAFPLGTTIGGMIGDCQSLDGSEITMRTMEEVLTDADLTMQTIKDLGVGKDNSCHRGFNLLRPNTYPSNIIGKQFYNPKDTMISAATQEARDKCLSILHGGRRSLTPAATIPAYHKRKLEEIEEEKTEQQRETDNSEVEQGETSYLGSGHLEGDHSTTRREEAEHWETAEHDSNPIKYDLFNRNDESTGLSEKEVAPPADQKHTKQVGSECNQQKSVANIIQLEGAPGAPSTNQVYFELNGELIPHAPLPSGWTVRISESKKRPYYTHPDWGTSWHCPILNPFGLLKQKSITEGIVTKATAVDGQESTLSALQNCEDDTSTTVGTSIMSVESNVSVASASCEKASNTVLESDISSVLSSSTATMYSHHMKRAVTMEQGDLVVRSDTEETESVGVQPLANCGLVNEGGESKLITTISAHTDSGTPSSKSSNSDAGEGLPAADLYRNELMQTVDSFSPDRKIAEFASDGICSEQKETEGETMALYESDRVRSPSQLLEFVTSSASTQSKNQLVLSHETAYPAVEDTDDSENSLQEAKGDAMALYGSDRIHCSSQLFKRVLSAAAQNAKQHISPEASVYPTTESMDFDICFIQPQKRRRGEPMALLSLLDEAESPIRSAGSIGSSPADASQDTADPTAMETVTSRPQDARDEYSAESLCTPQKGKQVEGLFPADLARDDARSPSLPSVDNYPQSVLDSAGLSEHEAPSPLIPSADNYSQSLQNDSLSTGNISVSSQGNLKDHQQDVGEFQPPDDDVEDDDVPMGYGGDDEDDAEDIVVQLRQARAAKMLDIIVDSNEGRNEKMFLENENQNRLSLQPDKMDQISCGNPRIVQNATSSVAASTNAADYLSMIQSDGESTETEAQSNDDDDDDIVNLHGKANSVYHPKLVEMASVGSPPKPGCTPGYSGNREKESATIRSTKTSSVQSYK